MATFANAMYFAPTAIDTYLQAQGNLGSSSPNQGLWLILSQLARTATGATGTATGAGATINTLGGAIYVGTTDQVAALARYIADVWSDR